MGASARDAEGGNAEAKPRHREEGRGTGIEGGSGGDYVVDEQHVESLQDLGTTQTEGISDVGGSGITLLLTLFVCVAMAYDGVVDYRTWHHLGDAAAEEFTLVVAAL